MLAPETEKRVYDGCCGSGGMFVQSEKCINWIIGEPTKLEIEKFSLKILFI
jgi:type I restriction-modification system DNA methylase subunit